jgi:hypothetical protein
MFKELMQWLGSWFSTILNFFAGIWGILHRFLATAWAGIAAVLAVILTIVATAREAWESAFLLLGSITIPNGTTQGLSVTDGIKFANAILPLSEALTYLTAFVALVGAGIAVRFMRKLATWAIG